MEPPLQGGDREDAGRGVLPHDGADRRGAALCGVGRPRVPAPGLRHAGAAALSARALSHHVRHAPLDGAPVCRVLDRRGEQRLLSAQPRRGAEGAFHRLRPGDAPRLRLRPPAGRRRRGQGRRGRGLHPGHGDPVLRHPAGPDVRLHDDERRRAARPGLLHPRRGGAGSGQVRPERDHPERHPEGVHGPQHLHLSAQGLDAHHRGHLRLHLEVHAQVQQHQHLRLPHPGGGRHGRHRAGLHAGGRPGVPAHRHPGGALHRRLRAAPVVLLGHRQELFHGGRQDARGPDALGQDRQDLQSRESQVHGAAHPLPDLRLEPDGAGSVQQRGAHLHRGAGGGAGAHAVPAHQRAGRGHRPADGLLRAHRAQHAALHSGRDEGLQGHRPVGRLLVRGGPDGPADPPQLGPHPGDRVPGRHGRGHRNGAAQDAHRGGGRAPSGPHRLRHRGDRWGQQLSSGQGGPAGDPGGRQHRGPSGPDRAAGEAARHPGPREGPGLPGRHHQGDGDGGGEPAGAGRRRGAGTGVPGGDLGRGGEGLRAPQGHHPLHLRHLQQRVRGRGDHRRGPRDDGRVRGEGGPPAPHHDRQDGAGRA